ATNGSPVVDGAGTAWQTANRGRGDRIRIDGVDYTILSVDLQTQLTLTSPFTGIGGAGKTYTIARQFTTLQAWEDCIDGPPGTACPFFPVASASLVADDRSEVGIAYKDSVFTSAGGVSIVRFAGSTTDAFHDITLTADAVNRHFGIVGDGVVLDMLAEPGSNGVTITDEFITVEWLEITGGAGMDGFEVSSISSPSQVTLRYNLIHDTANGDGMQLRDADLTVDVYNNIIYGTSKAIELNQEVPTSARILNNTIYDSTEGVFADDSGSCLGCKFDSVLLQNNIAHTFTGPAYFVPSTSSTGFAAEASSNNLASDATGTTHSAAGGGINSVPLANMNFVSATDLHITAGSAAINVGTDLSGIFTDDIDGDTRPIAGIWEIGADETSAAGANDISGTVFEDVNGDANLGGAVGVVATTVRLYQDDGDNVPDAGDGAAIDTVVTDGSGNYTFTSVADDTYWVVVDSRTISPNAGLNGVLGDVWAEQTYGVTWARCDDGTGTTVEIGAAGACYSGQLGTASDDAASGITSSEHLTRVVVAGANVTGIDSAFSFNAVTNTLAGDAQDDDAGNNRTVQGSLRQFIQNANGVTGANVMRFVPAVPTNDTGGGGNWWQIIVSNALPQITDAITTVDGTAYSRADGVTVRDDNPGLLGIGGFVGVDALVLSQVARPELELEEAGGVLIGL
ncbi:MAG: hypothetical protein ACE1ZX_03380, partial [Acidimicrobiia bacterium]